MTQRQICKNHYHLYIKPLAIRGVHMCPHRFAPCQYSTPDIQILRALYNSIVSET